MPGPRTVIINIVIVVECNALRPISYYVGCEEINQQNDCMFLPGDSRSEQAYPAAVITIMKFINQYCYGQD